MKTILEEVEFIFKELEDILNNNNEDNKKKDA